MLTLSGEKNKLHKFKSLCYSALHVSLLIINVSSFHIAQSDCFFQLKLPVVDTLQEVLPLHIPKHAHARTQTHTQTHTHTQKRRKLVLLPLKHTLPQSAWVK
ncbi:hypothetical protein CHARACLAT_021621 [Characodon lateralis]|uniref:Secreted protein n=1 Tax=Characodon lateralis TaxID=208331 RepID=A0ABU7F4Y6_9TELE|nr:hypothetical protein [Characodon lateralis]